MNRKQKAMGTTAGRPRDKRRAVRGQVRLPSEDFTAADFGRMEGRARRELARSRNELSKSNTRT